MRVQSNAHLHHKAQEEAIRWKHEAIGTEHILLGLIREGGGIAAKALEAIDITPKMIETGIEELVGKGTENVGPIVIFLVTMHNKVRIMVVLLIHVHLIDYKLS